MAKIAHKDLSRIRGKHKNEKMVFCSGGFDLTHAGHVLFFEDCKNLGDVLVVMVGGDKVMKHGRGDARPILNEQMRMKMVDSLKPVDYTIIDELVPVDQHPLQAIDNALEELRPDIYVINEDASDIPYREIVSKKHGTKLVILKRVAPPEFEKVSTTKIIEKIKGLN